MTTAFKRIGQANLLALSLLLAVSSARAEETPAATTSDAPEPKAVTAGDAPDPKAAANKIVNEEPEAFLNRYLTALQKANTMIDLTSYMATKPDMSKMGDYEKLSEEKKKAVMDMLKAFFEIQKASTPTRLAVTGVSKLGSDTLVKCKATDYKDKAKDKPGTIYTGKYLLRKGADSWLIVSEYWFRSDGHGMTMSSGTDPEAPPEKDKPKSAGDKYQTAVDSAIDAVWKAPEEGEGAVTVELKNTATGKFEIEVVRDKKGNAEAEAIVKAMLAKLVMPPLPPAVDTPYVNFQFAWGPKTIDNRMTQYFKRPSSVAQPVVKNSEGKPTTLVDWANQAATMPFKKTPVSGNIEGSPVVFKKAIMKPLSDGGYKIVFSPGGDVRYPRFEIFLSDLKNLITTPITMPVPSRKDARGLTFYPITVGRALDGSYATADDGFAGRLQFTSTTPGKVGGYVVVRVASDFIKASEINGYFYIEAEH